MKTLNTVFPYGMNLEYKCEKVDNAAWSCDYENLCIYKSFPKVEITRGCRAGIRMSQNVLSPTTREINSDSIISTIQEKLYTSNQNVFHLARCLIAKLNKDEAQKLWLDCIKKLNVHRTWGTMDLTKHSLLLIKDLAYHHAYPHKEFKTSKMVNRNTITLDFKNKLIEEINIHGIFKEEEISDMFPFQILNIDNSLSSKNVSQPIVSYRYGDTIQRKILNYNKVIQSDEIAENISCDCEQSNFKHGYHNHVVTGDLKFIEDHDLRRLLGKGLNFRPPEQRNTDKAFESFTIGIGEYIEKLSKKYKVAKVVFDGWKTKLLEKIKLKLSKISTNAGSNKKFIDTKLALTKLEKLQENFVFIPTDKSSNNISIVCKKFYLMNIKKELDLSFTSVN